MKSNFNYKLEDFAGRKCIIIEDLNTGGMSVTKNIENVLVEISGFESIDPANFMIVFKDSAGHWNGWDHTNNAFEMLVCDNAYHAIRRYAKRQLNASPIIHHNTEHMKKTDDPGDTQEEDDTEGSGALVD